MKLSRAAAWVCGFLFWAAMSFAQAAESKSAWQAEWDAAVEAAKKEGQITIYHTRGPFENVFTEFSKRYPIKVVSVTGRGSELISKIMAERRAGGMARTCTWARPARPWTFSTRQNFWSRSSR